MGLADRYYMRESSGGLHWSATTTLLVINVAVFVLQLTILPFEVYGRYLALSLEGVLSGFVWQFVTFQFLHGGWMHIIFNSIGLYFFGRAVESMLGSRRFVQLYLFCGVAGGVLQLLMAAALPMVYGGPVVGASAGVTGLIATFALMNWHNRFTLLFFFIPMVMSGKILFWFSAGMALLGMIFPGGGVAHAAHLGGLLGGTLWMKLGWHRDFVTLPWEQAFAWLQKLNPFRRRERHRQLMKAASIKTPAWSVSKPPVIDLPEEEFISKEVDPILDKISAHGIQSLTERERQILERARNKMAKR